MDIVTIVFLVIVALFALRGAMLGMTALLVRLAGIAIALFVAYRFQTLASLWLLDIWPHLGSSLASSIMFLALFMLTVLSATLCLQLLLSLFTAQGQAKSMAGRMAAAGINTGVGAVVCFLALWVYIQSGSLFINAPPVPASLQQGAQTFGHAVFGELLAPAHADELPASGSGEKQAEPVTGLPVNARAAETDTISTDDIQQLLQSQAVQQELIPALQTLVNEPGKAREMIDQHVPLLGRLLQSDAISFKSRDPERTEQLGEKLKYMINNPQEVEKMLDDPRVQQALEDYQHE